MQQYELLFILPGTMTEDETAPVVKEVEDIVTAAGGTGFSMQNMGKSRLAYPMKHIRYGYFFVGYFNTEAQTTKDIEQKLRLMTVLLRTVLRKADAGKVKVDSITAISDVTVREPRTSTRPMDRAESGTRAESKHVTAEEEARMVDTDKTEKKQATKAANTETKAEKIKMEEIDKKLDELLETDITDV